MPISPIRSVVAIVPITQESTQQVEIFNANAADVRILLGRRGINFRWSFLSDGSLLADACSVYGLLVRHEKPLGLATTLVEGYEACLAAKEPADVVVRLDIDHDPSLILQVIDQMLYCDVQAMFVPTAFSTAGQPRPKMIDIARHIATLHDGCKPVSVRCTDEVHERVLRVRFQAFRLSLLQELVPRLREGLTECQTWDGHPATEAATGGFDMLMLWLAAEACEPRLDFLFGGWTESPSQEYIDLQHARLEVIYLLFSTLRRNESLRKKGPERILVAT